MTRLTARCALLLCSMIAGCGGGGGGAGQTCEIDDDCASKFCKADGTCGEPAPDGGIGADDAGADASSALCMPDHDGIITLAELPFAAGRTGTFRVATNATWNTAGVAMTNGQRHWDLSGALANDQDVEVTLAAPTGTWWADAFPGATYATQLTSTSELRGVFALGSTTLELLGVVSPDGGTFKTELEYDGPAHVLKVPMQAGTTWTSSSTVSGFAQGALVAYTEEYESRVDQVGTLATPYGEFPVVRVVTDMTRTSGLATLATTRTFTWIAECFGPVATATSHNFESSDEFTNVAEVRRIAP